MTEDDLRFGQVYVWRPGLYDVPVMLVARKSEWPGKASGTWRIVNLIDDDRSSLGERRGHIGYEIESILLDPDIYRPEPE